MKSKEMCFEQPTQCTKPYTVERTKCIDAAIRQIVRFYLLATCSMTNPCFASHNGHLSQASFDSAS